MDIPQYSSREDIIQNMKDAGCSSETIKSCVACMDRNRKNELLERLYAHRSSILDSIHKEERQIDCLDYLVHQIRKC